MPRRRVDAPRRIAVADESQHRLTPDEAIAVAALEAEEVRAAVVPVDRRPEEEDLRQRVLGRGRRGLADRPHAPRPVLGAVDPIDRDVRAAGRDATRPRAPLREPRRVHDGLRARGDRLARLFERDRARGERDVGVDAEIGRVDAHARDAQRLDDVDRERTDARLRRDPAGMRPDANTERCTPSCTTANAPSMMPRFGYTAMPAAK